LSFTHIFALRLVSIGVPSASGSVFFTKHRGHGHNPIKQTPAMRILVGEYISISDEGYVKEEVTYFSG